MLLSNTSVKYSEENSVPWEVSETGEYWIEIKSLLWAHILLLHSFTQNSTVSYAKEAVSYKKQESKIDRERERGWGQS